MATQLKIGTQNIGTIASILNGVRRSSTENVYSQGWVRDSNWLPMPAVTSTEQKIVVLFAVGNYESNPVAFTMQGNYTVDWGQGTVTNYASNVRAERNFTFTECDPSTETVINNEICRQVIITITPQSGSNLTSVIFNVRHSGFTQNYTPKILDIVMSVPSCTSLRFGDTIISPSLMERCEIKSVGNVTNMSYMFQNCNSLQSIPLFNTQNVTNMSGMFNNCYSLQSIPLFNTQSVTNMSYMFQNCYSLQSIPLFNTQNVTNMSGMFNNCYPLQSVPLFNTQNVTSMSQMFVNCYPLQSVPLFNTQSVTSMSQMFVNCYSLQSVPLFNTQSVTNMSQTFDGCRSLQSVPLFNTQSVTNMSSMFNACLALQSVPLFNTQSVTNMQAMFLNCFSLQSVPLFNTQNVTIMTSMFQSCYSLQSVPLFNTQNVIIMTSMFNGCTVLQSVPSLNVSAVVTSADNASIFNTCRSLADAALSGTTQTISYINCNLGTPEIVKIFNNLGTAASGATITITGNIGVTNLTATDRLIATSKGWTIIG